MLDIARYLDAAILKPDMTRAEVEAAIQECIALRAMNCAILAGSSTNSPILNSW